MWKVLLISMISVYCFGQKTTSIPTEKLFQCDIFSSKKVDSTYCNYYISNYTDTVYFKQSNCLFDVSITSPVILKRKTLNGYAEGILRIHTQEDFSYSIEEGTFSDGIPNATFLIEYYNSGKIKSSGQYVNGQRYGTWTYFYENGQIQRIITLENGESWKELEFDLNNNIIYDYDFFKEKATATKK